MHEKLQICDEFQELLERVAARAMCNVQAKLQSLLQVSRQGGKCSVTSVMQVPRDSAKHVASSKRSCATEDPEHLRLRSDS